MSIDWAEPPPVLALSRTPRLKRSSIQFICTVPDRPTPNPDSSPSLPTVLLRTRSWYAARRGFPQILDDQGRTTDDHENHAASCPARAHSSEAADCAVPVALPSDQRQGRPDRPVGDRYRPRRLGRNAGRLAEQVVR